MRGRDLVYLDHNASTPLRPEVWARWQDSLDIFGNPSSVHKVGRAARRALETARSDILSFINAGARATLVFTSGATEANNLALRGCGCERMLISAIEHASVLEAAPASCERIPALPSGQIDLVALESLLKGTDRSTLVSVMYVNNETGVIQPIPAVVALARQYGALVHVDAVQAAGRLPIDIQALGVDYLTLSSHKIGGPQGVGTLILANCVTVSPLLKGGNQEKNVRAGTENVLGVIGFAAAAQAAARDLEVYQNLGLWRDAIEKQLMATVPEIKIFGQTSERVVNTTMFSVPGFPAETQLIGLDLAGICVSNGAACASGTVRPSAVLQAMGADKLEIESAIRVSLGWNTRQKDVEYFIEKWLELYERNKARRHA